MKLIYPACFYLCDDMTSYIAVVPDFPECAVRGENLAEAFLLAVDAASSWVLDTLEKGNTIPPASHPEDIPLEYDDGFINFIVLDMDSYAEKYGNKAVRKNLTIPAWLNTLAEKENVNFSAILQQALIKELDIIKP